MKQRVIVEYRPDLSLGQAPLMTTAEPGATFPGLDLDMTWSPVEVPAGVDESADVAMADGGGSTYLVRGQVEEEEREALEQSPEVVAVWSDAVVAAFSCGCSGPDGGGGYSKGGLVQAPGRGSGGAINPIDVMLAGSGTTASSFSLAAASPCTPTDCDPRTPKGSIDDVARYLGCDRLWEVGVRGEGVVVGIVDTGVNASRVANVIGGWSPNPAYPPGTDPYEHGSMCGTDVLGMAPDARLYDIGLLKSPASGGMTGLLSDAIAGYQWAINQFGIDGTPQILSNSWGVYQKAWAEDYATNAAHPFTRKVVEAIDLGIIVTFAAGNCGQVCPSGRCGGDSGPGRSIWGANGHPRVITVGAANTRGEWIGYTSQGPAALDPQKPDFCAPSHFTGYTNCDNGTSAANPVCAGVIALLRGHDPDLRQDAVKLALQQTAQSLCSPGWDPQSGHGMISAEQAYNNLFLFNSPLRHAAWIHGTSVEAEYPDRLLSSQRFGFYGLFEGRKGSFNWFHFAIPTPVIVSGGRLRLDSVMSRIVTDPDVAITNVHVYDGESRIQTYDNLSLSGQRGFDRFDVLNRSVTYGIGLTIGVQFGTADGPQRIAFISAGADFID